MKAIETCKLTKYYGKKCALKGLELAVEQGEIFALLGTNGAGKTTAVKILSTLILPSSGGGSVMGLDLVKDSMKIKELVGVSPQETAVAPNLSVKENLEFMAGIYGISNVKAKTEYLCRSFGLEDVMGQKAKTLSGGWQRRLSIALALVNDPKLLFLDEPTLGLDVLARRELWHIIEGLKSKTTVILTTHYMEEAEQLADSVGIMNGGEPVATGSVAELKERTGKSTLEEAFTHLVTGGRL